jgi:hypothetical protein
MKKGRPGEPIAGASPDLHVLNELAPMKLTHSQHCFQSMPVDETGYVTPALATLLSGLTPFRLRRLMIGRPDGVRSGRLRGRRLVHLSDILRARGPEPGRAGRGVTR